MRKLTGEHCRKMTIAVFKPTTDEEIYQMLKKNKNKELMIAEVWKKLSTNKRLQLN